MNVTSTRLACFELWGSNRSADHPLELPGLAGWVYSRPLDSAEGGGDVHYFSVCSKGMVSRVALADVAGHGSGASTRAECLRRVLQRHTDNWDQSALMRELNEAFVSESAESVYATAAVLGFYLETGELLFSSAGHPPALWYRAGDASWEVLQGSMASESDTEGLPLGLIPGTTYAQTAARLGADDVLILYTDGISEAMDPSGNELGTRGLLDMARGLTIESPGQISQALTAGVRAFRRGQPRRDDETLVVLRRTAD